MFKLQFSTDNAAFADDSKWMEIDTILRAVADEPEHERKRDYAEQSHPRTMGNQRGPCR